MNRWYPLIPGKVLKMRYPRHLHRSHVSLITCPLSHHKLIHFWLSSSFFSRYALRAWIRFSLSQSCTRCRRFTPERLALSPPRPCSVGTRSAAAAARPTIQWATELFQNPAAATRRSCRCTVAATKGLAKARLRPSRRHLAKVPLILRPLMVQLLPL